MRILAATILAFTLPAAVPRPEYPEPRFQRVEWLNLNGEWQFEFDDNNAGMPAAFSRKITVPFAFETKLSGIGDTGFHPWIWYRRTVQIPPGWQGRRVLIHFGAVDYQSWVWINGQLAGSHEGGSTPFRFDITPLLKPGDNTVVVKAWDPPQDRFIPRGKQYWEPKSRGIFYTRTSGIWQPVWIEATGASYLSNVRVTTHNDGRVRFEARIERPSEGVELHATVTRNGATVAAGSARATRDQAHLELRAANPQLWTHLTPNLYDVKYELRKAGAVLDTVNSYFGIREVTVNNGRIYLNGRPVYLKWLLDQGYWPESTLTPPTDEAIKFDINVSKEMGFNGVRKHQKLEDPRFLYWADKLGFLVSDEMANAYEYDSVYAARFQREWAEVVERDYSHPSVVMWVPINESWGVPNLSDKRQQNHLRALYWLTRSLDSTRPVVENDGWEHVDTMDLFTIHDYARDGERLYAKYKDLGKPGVKIPDNGRAIWAPGFGKYEGQPFLLSEFGGIAFIPAGTNVPQDSWGYAGVEKSPEAALARLKSLYEAVAKIPAFAGVCYTQITDVEQEVNGLLTYDRRKKFDSAAVKAINDLLP
ncbi:MAG: glycoside hydrolase family 2 [Acidobacteria bacterium]|nr:glycoside hydrolase family 2 [Acidobacteriota bacterium]